MTALQLAKQNAAQGIEDTADEAATVKAGIEHGYFLTIEPYIHATYELHGKDVDPDWEADFREAFAKL